MWMRRLFKEWGIPLLIIGILYFTGLLSDVAAYAQRAVLFTGIMNADVETVSNNEARDFEFEQTIRTSDGKLMSMEQFKGKVIFLNLWASWCAPCKAEMPGIEEVYLELKDLEKIEFVLLNIDRNEEAAEKYMNRHDFAFPYYKWTGSLNQQLAVGSIPATFIVDKEGKIVKKHIGMAKYNTPSFKKLLIKLANK